MIILITGTPCVGKSTIAKLLAEKINGEIIDLKQIAKKHKIAEEKDIVIIDETKINSVVKKEIEKRKNYVIPSHLSQHVSPEIADYCFVLRCNPEILKERLKKRNYSKDKVEENVLCEILDSSLIESLEFKHKKHLYEINTTNKNPEKIVNEILEIIQKKKKPFFGEVKWKIE